jgi:hypothetical protein
MRLSKPSRQADIRSGNLERWCLLTQRERGRDGELLWLRSSPDAALPGTTCSWEWMSIRRHFLSPPAHSPASSVRSVHVSIPGTRKIPNSCRPRRRHARIFSRQVEKKAGERASKPRGAHGRNKQEKDPGRDGPGSSAEAVRGRERGRFAPVACSTRPGEIGSDQVIMGLALLDRAR